MLPLAALILILPSAHAELVYRQSCGKVEKARMLDVAFEVAVERGGKEVYRGNLAVADGNRLRAELRGGHGPDDRVVVVSDGKRTAMNDVVDATPPPKGTTAELLGCFGRGGAYPTMFRTEVVGPGETPGITPEQVRATGFEWRGAEQVGGRRAVVVGYRLGVKRESYGVTAWIDAETHLPIKRVFTCREGGRDVTATETYGRVVVDGKIDPRLFDLPKDK